MANIKPKAAENTPLSTRELQIANAIHAEAKKIHASVKGAYDASQVKKGHLDNAFGSRLDIAKRIADLSTRGDWTADELDRACKHAAQDMPFSNNDAADTVASTLGVFCSEMKQFGHPNVRYRVHTLIANVHKQWEIENAIKLDPTDTSDTPAHRFKTREYSLVLFIARLMRKDENVSVLCPQDVIDICAHHDKSTDVKRVKAKLNAVVKQLQGIREEFDALDTDDIQTAIDYLDEIAARKDDSLEDTRKHDLTLIPSRAPGTVLAPKRIESTPVKAPPVAAQDETDLAAGAFDYESVLNGIEDDDSEAGLEVAALKTKLDKALAKLRK